MDFVLQAVENSFSVFLPYTFETSNFEAANNWENV